MHAVAIRLRDNGFDDHAIAAAAGIDEHEVRILLQIAERKLTNLMCLDNATSQPADITDRRPSAASG